MEGKRQHGALNLMTTCTLPALLLIKLVSRSDRMDCAHASLYSPHKSAYMKQVVAAQPLGQTCTI